MTSVPAWKGGAQGTNETPRYVVTARMACIALASWPPLRTTSLACLTIPAQCYQLSSYDETVVLLSSSEDSDHSEFDPDEEKSVPVTNPENLVMGAPYKRSKKDKQAARLDYRRDQKPMKNKVRTQARRKKIRQAQRNDDANAANPPALPPAPAKLTSFTRTDASIGVKVGALNIFEPSISTELAGLGLAGDTKAGKHGHKRKNEQEADQRDCKRVSLDIKAAPKTHKPSDLPATGFAPSDQVDNSAGARSAAPAQAKRTTRLLPQNIQWSWA